MKTIKISIKNQQLILLDQGRLQREYSVSTGKNGVGELMDSEKTPRGSHIIRAKIGAGCEENTVFVGRRPTGEIYEEGSPDNRDWILTRILWLSGKEPGRNRLGNVDTMRRYIYIHGSPDKVKMGTPGSRGCIRMWNSDIVELFDLIDVGTEIDIGE